MTLAEKYIRDYEKYIIEYGKKTACLIQVGSFYEMYSKDNPENDIYKILHDISDICDFSIVPRSYTVDDDNHVLSLGFGVCNR